MSASIKKRQEETWHPIRRLSISKHEETVQELPDREDVMDRDIMDRFRADG